MNRLFLLLLVTCFTLSLNAQKVTKEIVTYTYLRNPLKKLDTSIKNYVTTVEVSWLQKERQKQKDYELELAKAEQEHQDALEAYEDKSIGSKLAKQILLGDGKPTRRAVEKPISIPEPNLTVLSSKISLDGFSQGDENSILIKVIYQDIYVGSAVDMDITKDDLNYKKRSITVKQPVEFSLITPDGDIIFNKVSESSKKDVVIESKNIKEGDEWDKYLKEKWETFFRSELMKHYSNTAKDINQLINYWYGYSNVKRRTMIYKGKGKKHSYETHVLALKKAQRAYENLISERKESIDVLKKSIEIWEKELTKSEPSNKKARISNDITQALILNIVEAKMMIGDYNGATDYCDKLDIMPNTKNKYIRKSEDLRKIIKDEKERNQ